MYLADCFEIPATWPAYRRSARPAVFDSLACDRLQLITGVLEEPACLQVATLTSAARVMDSRPEAATGGLRK